MEDERSIGSPLGRFIVRRKSDTHHVVWDQMYLGKKGKDEFLLPTSWLETEGFNIVLWYALERNRIAKIQISDWPVDNKWFAGGSMPTAFQNEVQAYLENRAFQGDGDFDPEGRIGWIPKVGDRVPRWQIAIQLSRGLRPALG